MKRYATALFFCTLALSSQLAHADIIDDAIGNIQQAINDAYNPDSSRSDDDDDGRYDDGRYDDGSYQGSRQQRRDDRQRYNDRQRQLDDRRRQLESDQRRLDDDY
ncbi:TPA: DDRRRQL repeat protein YjdP [Klebsiella aerogenes]